MNDRDILRGLGEQIAERASSPANRERRDAWYALDAGTGDRTMVLAEIGGLPDAERDPSVARLSCTGARERQYERMLRTWIYEHDILQDDHVIEARIPVSWAVDISDYGVEVVYHEPAGDGHVTARTWDSPVKDLGTDMDKLHPRTVTLDRDESDRRMEHAHGIFDGVLRVERRGAFYWTLGLTWTAIELTGLEHFMIAMYDDPDGVHRLMKFLADDHIQVTSELERLGVYTPNNENDYIGSGSMGYTASLGGKPGASGDPSKAADAHSRIGTSRSQLWCLSESQETVGVSPEMFAEFVFPYQKSITDLFGRVYYGCCEPVDSRIHVIRQMRNLARVSVSPWADEERMAEACGRELVYSRKPNPATVSDAWDEELLRSDIRRTLDVAGDCRLEIIMKDVHTLANEPDRLARWVAIARDEIERRE